MHDAVLVCVLHGLANLAKVVEQNAEMIILASQLATGALEFPLATFPVLSTNSPHHEKRPWSAAQNLTSRPLLI